MKKSFILVLFTLMPSIGLSLSFDKIKCVGHRDKNSNAMQFDCRKNISLNTDDLSCDKAKGSQLSCKNKDNRTHNYHCVGGTWKGNKCL